MRIAICDNDFNNIKTLKNDIYNYANRNKVDLVIDTFFKGEQLLDSKQSYNLIFIEYSLPNINGLETIAIFKKMHPHTSVIFISCETNVVFNCFKVNPFRFLKKPLSSFELEEALDSFFKNKYRNHPIWIKEGKDTVCINTADIVYLEALNKHCFIHLNEEKIECNKTMAKVYNSISNNMFLKINRAFIINIKFIKKYNNDSIYLKNGQVLHISRTYLKEFKEYFKKIYNPIIM